MTGGGRSVLILGADGFIGRHIAFHLRAEGWDVLASARRTARLEQMGFATFRADLGDPATHTPEFWRTALAGGRMIVNAAGLLTGSDAAFKAVHVDAPTAAYAALEPGAGGLLISAVGIEADTPFARWRRAGEEAAAKAGLTLLRPGLVMGETSYGGTSLARALAALPGVTPVVGGGDQVFNPIHADDLARVVATCLITPPGPGHWEIGGPERITQAGLLTGLRNWLGLRPARLLPLGTKLANLLGALGDAFRMGPISRTSVAQLAHGVEADERPLSNHLAVTPRGVTQFLAARPAGTQDLWHARLFLLRPLLRLTLMMLWLASGLLGLFLPPESFLPLMAQSGLPDVALIVLARGFGMIDLAIALALARNWRPFLTGATQLAVVGGYTIGFTLLAPALWLLPLGGLLKNLPILVLILLWIVLEDER
ncbi:DoxX-like family protein [Roseovarius sp. 2305UL8-3]|uniref:DoxX-like family protein n=1 Tax=Roseovarius conchicola TaxID=3121636 RepID=UPI003527031F